MPAANSGTPVKCAKAFTQQLIAARKCSSASWAVAQAAGLWTQQNCIEQWTPLVVAADVPIILSHWLHSFVTDCIQVSVLALYTCKYFRYMGACVYILSNRK